MPDPTAADALPVLAETLADPDPSALVASNVDFVNMLLREHLNEGEIANDALRSYCVDHYLAQMRNGGFSQFVYNTQWGLFNVRMIREGLRAMGAPRQLEAFEDGARVVEAMEPARLDAFFASDYFGDNPERGALNAPNAAFERACETEDLCERNAAWLRAHPSLCPMPSIQSMLDEAQRRGMALPDRVARETRALSAEPRYVKLIRALCTRMDQTLEQVTTGDPDLMHEGRRTLAWHFLTDRGHYFMVEDGGRAIAFDADGRRACEVSATVIEPQRTRTLDNNSYATNPGTVPVNPLVWARYYPRKFLEAGAGVVFFLLMAAFVAPMLGTLYVGLCVLIAVAMPLHLASYWRQVREHFRYGCANPAVIVSTKPMLIAVATDLATGSRPFPVIRIVERPLARANGHAPKVGARLSTVSVYLRGADPNLPRWANVHPQPVDYATRNRAILDRTMRTFHEDDWTQLQSWLDEVPKPFRPGLYPIGWKA